MGRRKRVQPAASAARNATVRPSAKDRVPSPPSTPPRLASIDTLRGLGIVAMIAYHFVFDLRFHGVVRADFENGPFWLTYRAAVVTTFLLLVGVSLVLADRAGEPAARFWRRIGGVAACALAASIGSYVVFPQTFIYFGILHCIAVSAILARPLARKPALATGLGIAVIVAGLAFSHPAFDTRALSWLGFTTVKPPTQDFVPLFPWLGVVLVGIGVGHALAQRDFSSIAWLAGAPRGLRWLGRHSLAVYMVHQPVLLGLLWFVVRR